MSSLERDAIGKYILNCAELCVVAQVLSLILY